MATSSSPLSITASRTLQVVKAAGGGGSGEIFFEDDFVSGDLTKTLNGFSWTGANKVVPNEGRLGGSAARFRYGPNAIGQDSSQELGFFLAPAGSGLTELWIEYYLKIPSNYIQRNDPPSNNKFFALWAENYSNSNDIQFVSEFERVNDTESNIRAICMTGSGCLAGSSPNPVVTAGDLGQWVRVRIHQKAGNGDGASEIWKNNNVVYSISNYTHFASGGNSYWRSGYLMGWANSGFADQTDFYVDEFKVYNTDPQWSFA
jgi:hypothetical protein